MSTSAALAAAAFPEHTASLAGGVALTPGQIPYPDANGRLTGDVYYTYNSATHRLNLASLGVNSGTNDSLINVSATNAQQMASFYMDSGTAYPPGGIVRALTMNYNYHVTGLSGGGAAGGGSLIYGGSTVGGPGNAPLGSPGGYAWVQFVNNSGSNGNEYNAFFAQISMLGPDDGTPFPSSTPGRIWITDMSAHGSVGVQPGGLGGIHIGVNNYFDGSPAGTTIPAAPGNPRWDPRSASWNGTTGVTPNPSSAAAFFSGSGAGMSTHSPSYPLDQIVWIGGQTGAAGVHTGNRGALVGLMMGGKGSEWGQPSRFGTAIFARDYDYAAYEVGAPFAGTVQPRSYAADAGSGPAVIGDGIQAGSAVVAAAHIATVPATLTVSGNEITDATRAVNTQGDGRSADSSFGVWEATTNLIANGGAETNTTGATDHSSTTTRTTAQFKFGTASYQVVTSNAQANEGPSWAFTGAAATAYACSAWVRGSGTARIALFDSVSGKQASSPVTLSSTWQRISVVATTGAASSGFAAYIETDVQQNTTFDVDGVQAEAKGYPTPYVQTDGGTAARSAARVRMTPTPLNTHQHWIAIRMRMGAASTALAGCAPYYWGDGGANSFFTIFKNGLGSNTWNASMKGGVQTGPSIVQAMAAGDSVTFVAQFIYGVSVGFSINGSAISTTAGAGSPVLTALPTLAELGMLNNGSQVDGEIFWVAAGIGTLTSADAALIHGFGNADPAMAHFAALNSNAANPTFFWSADTTAAKQGIVLTGTNGLVDLTQAIAQGQHGESAQIQYAEELITLATGAAFTDSTANLLPANSEILSVDTYVTTTITTAANWSVGDPTTAARFSSANSTLAATTSQVGLNHKDGAAAGAASAQKAAAKVRITCNANPGAGAVRVTVKYIQHAPPTS